MIKARMDSARKEMERQGIDCLVVSPSSDLYYLTGYRGMAMERPTFLLLMQKDAFLVLPAFEATSISARIREQITCVPWTETQDAYEKARGLIPDTFMRAAICNTAPSVMFYNLQRNFDSLGWTVAGPLMAALRRVKTAEEIGLLTEAQHRAGKAFRRLLESGIGGMSELEAGERLRRYCAEEGMKATGVGIVASGCNSAYPHYHTGSRVIGKGDAVLFDFGAEYGGYQSDMTRMAVVGNMPEGFDEIYDIVLSANEAAFRAIRPGVRCEQIDSAARDIIGAAGYGEHFTHRLGHGIGLDVHEEPYMVSGNGLKLEPGNVFSVEPGIYIENRFGIRIEDIAAVTEDGAKRLTDAPRGIAVVD